MKEFKKILFNMIPIIFGILIALFINDWKDASADKKYLNQALESISKDIIESKESVDEVLSKHNSLKDSILASYKDDTKSIDEILVNSGGLQYPVTKNIALRFFIREKTELIDYNIISILTDIEEAKRIMDLKFEKFLDFMNENYYETSIEKKKLFNEYLSNVMASEIGLLELYNNYLNPEETDN